MRRLFLILLLTLSSQGFAQKRVTVQIESLFAFDPLYNNYSAESLPSVATYIEDWREYSPQTSLYIIDSLSWGYRHYCQEVDTTLLPRVMEYLDAELITTPDSLHTPKSLAHFPQSRVFNDYFNEDIQSIRRYYATPLLALDTTLYYDAYADNDFEALFHTFQCESTGAELSIFSPPYLTASLPKETYISNITRLFYYDNDLVTVEMSGSEIKELLSQSYSRRFYRVRHEEDDMLRYRTPAYLFLGIYGTEFTVNVSKPEGRNIENFKLDSEKRYTVALNSFLARDREVIENYGSYKELLIKWLKLTKDPLRLRTATSIQPRRITEVIRQRESKSIFGKLKN